jgi:Tfp pilus assembly protein PilE
MMVVVILIGVLAAVAVFMFTRQTNRARAAEVPAIFTELQARQEQYYLENNAYVHIGEGTWFPDSSPTDTQRTFNLTTSAGLTSLRVNFDKGALWCSYTTAAGKAGDATNAGGAISVAHGFNAAVPNQDWYYVAAICDFNGNGIHSTYFKPSNADQIAVTNQGE